MYKNYCAIYIYNKYPPSFSLAFLISLNKLKIALLMAWNKTKKDVKDYNKGLLNPN